ncbi:MAG TPA: hypothetical protein VM681_08600 [Candidatus Thermoplasmatota archaeon]|nr:hypothetical protein [Candidatus Thermoplasmatota archaeon]
MRVLRRGILVGAMLCASLFFAAPTGAQQPVCAAASYALAVDPATARLPPGETAAYNVTLASTDAVTASVRLSFSQPDAAEWSRAPEAEEFTLAPGSTKTVVLRLTAPQSVGAARFAGVTATASVTCPPPIPVPGAPPVSGPVLTQTVTASLEVPPPPFVPPSGGGVGLGVLLLFPLALAAVGAGAWWYLRSMGAPPLLSAPEPRKNVEPGKGVSFPLRLRNGSSQRATLRLDVQGGAEGWTAFLAMPDVQLDPREERTLYVLVRSPAGARAGEHVEFSVTARAPQGGPTHAAKLEAFVVGAGEGGAVA